jgi:hypothetical protein
VLSEVAATLSLEAALDEPAWYALVATATPGVLRGSDVFGAEPVA